MSKEVVYFLNLVPSIISRQKRSSQNQLSKNNTRTPHINSSRVLRMTQQQLWSSIPPRRNIRAAHKHLRVYHPRQPKITNFHITIFVHQQIPRLLNDQQITRSLWITLDLWRQLSPSSIWNMKNFQWSSVSSWSDLMSVIRSVSMSSETTYLCYSNLTYPQSFHDFSEAGQSSLPLSALLHNYVGVLDQTQEF